MDVKLVTRRNALGNGATPSPLPTIRRFVKIVRIRHVSIDL